jgi:polysaccharide chain length determinant protein (PEP-CTERM system associated)
MGALPNLVRRYGAAAWRSRWIALLLAWIVCVGGWVVVSTLPNQYRSTARLYVDADAVLTPLLRGLALDNSSASDLDVMQRTLLSRPNLEKLISKTDLDQRAETPANRERLLQALTTEIHIQPQTRNLFTIEYTDKDPKLARDVVQTIITLFVESATGNSRDDMENARQFLTKQIAAYEEKLRQMEQQRAAFQSKYADVLPTAGGASRSDAARQQVQTLQGQLADVTARRDLLKQQLSSTTPLLATDSDGVPGSPGRSSALVEAERNLQVLRLRLTEQNPDVVAARGLVAALKATGGGGDATSPGHPAAAHRSVPNPIYEQLQVRLVDAEGLIVSLQRQLNEATQDQTRVDAVMHSAPGVQAEYVNMIRDYDVLRKNYEELVARREAMRITAAADSEADKVKLRVIDSPQVPTVPVGPKRLLLTAGVLVAGLGAGLGVAFLLTQADNGFYTVQDLRRVGLPVLGGISMLPQRRTTRADLGVAVFVVGTLLLIVMFAGVASHPFWLSRFV